jgi:hypothetical protein
LGWDEMAQEHLRTPFGLVIWHDPNTEPFSIPVIRNESGGWQIVRQAREHIQALFEYPLVPSPRFGVCIKHDAEDLQLASL